MAPRRFLLEAQIQSPAVVTTNPNAKVIKRYQNRKLYDTQQSCYVTLEDIAKMIRNNEDVVVVDNKTKKDITSSTLTQIIFEAEKKAKNYISIETLREIIQTGTGSISSYLEKALNKPLAARPSEAADVKDLLDSTTRSFDDIQKKLEDRLARSADKGDLGGMKEGINQLHQKLNSLETRLRQFELEN
ncbi:MAG: regulator for granula-associated protein [Oligoflexia bacterium]|nr:regulator for granula-associated protein [Oligoflexia bacterium]